ncbi:MAG: GNAT family N-acetyltransferase [Acetatifactor sp.]|nr:GNAT family N-acetyltransferase [Acetatifactor sp.]
MRYREITKQDDAALAKMVRDNLKAHNLDLPGTVYFDDNLDHLSDYYLDKDHKRFYYVLLDDDDNIIGGIGLAEFELFEDCAELQKLYLVDNVKGSGLGYKLIELIENKAREYGYKRLYLETHTNLEAALHIYEKSGFKAIEKPVEVVHALMNRFYIKEL